MTLNHENKVDLLWKKHKGVASTASNKEHSNERYRSSTPIFQRDFWADSDLIPRTAPSASTVTGNELWAEVIAPRRRASAVQMLPDTASSNTAWVAVRFLQNGLDESNIIRNWVPDTFDRSYTITVWAGNPYANTGDAPVRLTPTITDREWEFDYSSGVLVFPNGIPPIAIQRGIWIEGWTYIGAIGRETDESGAANGSKIRTFTFTTAQIADGASVDFTFPTGGKCTLVEAKTSVPATLECHAISSRTDSNPYRFISIQSHLVDDGSYIVGGQRYYGERFIQLINMQDTTSDVTYWRVYNNSGVPSTVSVIVKVA